MKAVKYKGKLSKNSRGIYRKVNNQIILGKSLNIYIHNGDYYLAKLNIYADGMIDCW